MNASDSGNIPTPAMAAAWSAAAVDLGVRFISPFEFECRGTIVHCTGWLPDFGGPKGAIIAGRFDADEVLDMGDEMGYYCSGLSPYYYETYQKEGFMETLNDWGWFGALEKAPTWFTGALRAHGGRDSGT